MVWYKNSKKKILWDLNFNIQVIKEAYKIYGLARCRLVKNLPGNAGDMRDLELILGSGRFPGGGHGNPLQYSSLENPIDRGAWWATVHGVTKNQTKL